MRPFHVLAIFALMIFSAVADAGPRRAKSCPSCQSCGPQCVADGCPSCAPASTCKDGVCQVPAPVQRASCPPSAAAPPPVRFRVLHSIFGRRCR